jgi:two-component system phosphate regulon response regulator PhoB
MNIVLVVEEDTDTIELISMHLRREGYEVMIADSAQDAMHVARNEHPNLILLELALTRTDGLRLLDALCGDPVARRIPVIALSNRAAPGDCITALEHGATDFMPKPFAPKELMLRIRAVLKYTQVQGDQADIVGPFYLDSRHMRLQIGNAQVPLTPTEMRLMAALIASSDRVVARQDLQQAVWGDPPDAASRSVDTHLKRLREKLGDYSANIQTIRGCGFRLVTQGVKV